MKRAQMTTSGWKQQNDNDGINLPAAFFLKPFFYAYKAKITLLPKRPCKHRKVALKRTSQAIKA